MTEHRTGQAPRIAAALALGAALLASALALPAERAAAKRSQCAGARVDLLVDPVKLLAIGTRRDDVISGTPANETIVGRPGDDRACGHGGRDLVRDGPGADRVRAGSGRDRVRGGNGRDRLSGGRGRDRIRAADGARDRVHAGKGRDKVAARDDVKDSVNCGPGYDTAMIDSDDVLRSCERVKLGGMPDFALPSWSDGLWSDPSAYTTIQTGDIDGDGRDELIGRSPAGIEAFHFDSATGQWLPLYNGGALGMTDAGGWDRPQYYSTIQTADVNGDKKAELLARAGDGLHVWQYDPSSATWTEIKSALIAALSDAAGFDQASLYETIQTGDIDGDGLPEILAREPDGLHVWRWNSGTQGFDALPQSAVLDELSNGYGQTDPQFYSTIQTGDIDGDGRDDVLARVKFPSGGTPALIWWRFLPGDRWVTEPPIPVGADPGLASPSQYSTIQTANLDSDKEAEIIVRLSDGVHEYELVPKTFNIEWRELPALGRLTDAAGGNAPQSYLTIQTADLDGVGAAEVIGRLADGLHVYRFVPTPDQIGGSWQEVQPSEGDFSDANGWDQARYYWTIQTAHVGSGSARDLIARGLTGVQTVRLDTAKRSWVSPSAQFPDYSSGEEAIAYQAINAYIGGQDNPRFDLRQAYPDALSANFDAWRQDLTQVPQPAGVSDQVWDEVKAQLAKELQNGKLVLSWYDDASAGGYLHSLIDDKFLGLSMDTSADLLKFNAQKNAELVMEEWQVFEGVLEGLSALDALSGEAGEIAVVTTSLVDGAATAGLGEPDVQAAIDGIEGKYIALRNRLNSDFQTALKGIGEAKIEIEGDYGLQSAVGGLIGSNFWKPLTGDPRAIAIAGAERNYDISAWQTITPASWFAFRFAPDLVHDYCDGGVPIYPKGNCEWRPGDGSGWTLAYSTCGPKGGPGDGCKPVQQGLVNTLFGQTSQGCQEVWDLSTCSLGQSLSDVFLGQNGWQNLPLWTCQKRSQVLGGIKCTAARN